MGYILPVNHHQYYDYQRRTIKEKADPFYIERPYKTMLRTEYHDIYSNQSAILPGNHPGLKLSTPKTPTPDKLYAELTGKGRHFRRSV
ncbi:MAG TPA: hypothetical protein VK097_04815 [Lentibacillus sp.]|jgi:hypothetical protein|uniref:hypothetical protein n=1 Tax=Lentibacillus sp. TaxID=1925746 RepID=UPI002B4B800F|nr:hypothetical protein [Lentibacillus sp.]HLR61746.1 hypothetical protein [Lentibacillus sp.]